ncbi:MAG: hypothetical protein R3B06_02860 [Kofleriaceae bacterium]
MRSPSALANVLVAATAIVAVTADTASASPRLSGPEVMVDSGLSVGMLREQLDDIWELYPTLGLQLNLAGAPARLRVLGASAGRHLDVALAPEVSLTTWRNDVSNDVAIGLGARLELRVVNPGRRAVSAYVARRRLGVGGDLDPATTTAAGVVLRPGGGWLRYGAEVAYTDRTGGGVWTYRDGAYVPGQQPWYLTTLFVGAAL